MTVTSGARRTGSTGSTGLTDRTDRRTGGRPGEAAPRLQDHTLSTHDGSRTA